MDTASRWDNAGAVADESLRDLRRRHQLAATLEDRAALLTARLRSGALAEKRILLAASLGDPASCAVVGEAARPGEDVAPWIADLQELGGLALMRRAALASLRLCFEHWGKLRDLSAAKELWEEGRVFALCPCVEHLPHHPWTGVGAQAYMVRGWTTLAWSLWPWACDSALHWAQGHLTRRLGRQGQQALRDALRRDLVPWALSESDPLRATWQHSNSPLSRDAIVAAIETIPAGSRRAQRREIHQLILSPMLHLDLESLEVGAAVAKALRFELPDSDPPELLDYMAHQAKQFGLLERAGQTSTLQSFLAHGWRTSTMVQGATQATDFDFNF